MPQFMKVRRQKKRKKPPKKVIYRSANLARARAQKEGDLELHLGERQKGVGKSQKTCPYLNFLFAIVQIRIYPCQRSTTNTKPLF